MIYAIHSLSADEQGQDIAEYAVMLAVILVLLIGTIRLVGTNSNTVFSYVASAVQALVVLCCADRPFFPRVDD